MGRHRLTFVLSLVTAVSSIAAPVGRGSQPLANELEAALQGQTTSIAMPARRDVRAAATRVGNYWMKKNNAGANNNGWDGGVLMIGIIEHWRQYGIVSYKDYARAWAEQHAWGLLSDGCKLAGNYHNRMTAGYTYLRLLQSGLAGATVARVTQSLRDQLALPVSPEITGLVNHKFPGCTSRSFSWKAVDANFTALPVWIAMGAWNGNPAYYTRGSDLQNYQVNKMRLEDATSKLWYRDEGYKTKLSPNGRKIHWGRGQGWIAAGLAITLTELPESRPEYGVYRARFSNLMQALRARQREDGFWNMNVADPDHYPAPEISATALITFAMAQGVNLGILDGNTYGPVAAKAWNAMVATAIRNDGFLGYCQKTGSAPVPPTSAKYPDEDSTSNACVGTFLLAGTAIHDLSTRPGKEAAIRYEAETMATTVSKGDSQSDVISNYASGGASNSATLNAVNDRVRFTATNVPAGTYKLRVRFRRSPANGIWQLTQNGVEIGSNTDGYDADPHYAEVDVGTVHYSSTSNRVFAFKAVGRNVVSNGYGIGIDCIKLVNP